MKTKRVTGKSKYKIEIFWSDEDDCYVAKVPELPGCGTDGTTYEEAARNAQEAILSYIGALAKEGKPAPVPFADKKFSGSIPLRVDPVVHRNLAIKARLEGMSLNKYLQLKLTAE